MKAAINSNSFIEVLCESSSCDEIKKAIANRKRTIFANAAANDKAQRLKWIKKKSSRNKNTEAVDIVQKKKRNG